MTSDLDPRPAQDWAGPSDIQNSPSTPESADQPAAEPSPAPVATAPVTPPSRRIVRFVRPAILVTAFAVTFGVGIGVGRAPDLVGAGVAAASPTASFNGNEEALINEA